MKDMSNRANYKQGYPPTAVANGRVTTTPWTLQRVVLTLQRMILRYQLSCYASGASDYLPSPLFTIVVIAIINNYSIHMYCNLTAGLSLYCNPDLFNLNNIAVPMDKALDESQRRKEAAACCHSVPQHVDYLFHTGIWLQEGRYTGFGLALDFRNAPTP